MLNWLKSLLHIGLSGLEDLWHKFLSVISTVYSYIDKAYRSTVHELSTMYDYIIKGLDNLTSYIDSVYHTLYHQMLSYVHDIYHWASAAIDEVRKLAEYLYNTVVSDIYKLTHLVNLLAKQIAEWIIKNIYDPLYNDIHTALYWIDHEGKLMLYYLTHPSALAELLAKYGLSSWAALMRRYGPTVVRWVVRQSISIVPDVVSVMEDIISKVL